MDRVIVKCPTCGARICDKVESGKGKIEIKCQKCKSIVTVDLAFRRSRYYKYRIA